MKLYVSSKARCPYYLHERRQIIDCIGVQEGSITHLTFANPTDCYNYKKEKCQCDYHSCAIYQMLNKERGEDY